MKGKASVLFAVITVATAIPIRCVAYRERAVLVDGAIVPL